MKEKCPKCGYKFGFRGPKNEIERNGKRSRKKIRYFCPSCSVEVFYYEPRMERFLNITGYVGLLIGSLISILRIGISYNALPKAVEEFFFALGFIGLGGSLCFSYLKQHYKNRDTYQPENSADVTDHAAD